MSINLDNFSITSEKVKPYVEPPKVKHNNNWGRFSYMGDLDLDDPEDDDVFSDPFSYIQKTTKMFDVIAYKEPKVTKYQDQYYRDIDLVLNDPATDKSIVGTLCNQHTTFIPSLKKAIDGFYYVAHGYYNKPDEVIITKIVPSYTPSDEEKLVTNQ